MISNGHSLQSNYPKIKHVFKVKTLISFLSKQVKLFLKITLNMMLAYTQWMPFMRQLGNHFSIILVYCLYIYTLILFSIPIPLYFSFITLLNCISFLFNCFEHFENVFLFKLSKNVMLGHTGNNNRHEKRAIRSIYQFSNFLAQKVDIF